MEFLTNWLWGFIMCSIVLGGILGIFIFLYYILTWLGAWALLFLVPAGFGLAVAIAEL